MDDFKFTSHIPAKRTLCHGNGNVENRSSVEVKWSVNIDLREWGIRSIAISVERVSFDYCIETFTEDDIAYDSQRIVLGADQVQIEVASAQLEDGYLPIHMEYDFETNSADIEFG